MTPSERYIFIETNKLTLVWYEQVTNIDFLGEKKFISSQMREIGNDRMTLYDDDIGFIERITSLRLHNFQNQDSFIDPFELDVANLDYIKSIESDVNQNKNK